MTRHLLARPLWKRSGLIALATMVLIGCSPGAASPPPSVPVEPPPAVTATPTPAFTPPTEAPPSPMATLAEATAAPPLPTPTVRRGLHATDPGSVTLAAGRPQLVEFFAFW